MTNKITGGCLCGAVRYEIRETPKLQIACHCDSCRKSSGSAFVAAAVAPRAVTTMEGTVTTFAEKADSGREVSRCFCPTCGSTVYSEIATAPDAYVIQAGTLDDPSWFRPKMNFFAARALDWAPVDPGCKNFDAYPG